MKWDLKLRSRIGRVLTWQEHDQNFERLAYDSGDWVAGTYTKHERVHHNLGWWACDVLTTTEEPGTGTDWRLLSNQWTGAWTPGMYFPRQIADHEGAQWICVMQTSQEPAPGTSGWNLMGPRLGRGAMEIDAAKVSLGTIGAGWEPVDDFDSFHVTPVGLSMVPATGVFSFNWLGLWQIFFTLILEHNETNQSRKTQVRLFNVTEVTEVSRIPVFIARNQPGTNVSIQFPADIVASFIGDDFRFEIGGGDNITVISVDAQSVEAFQHGPTLT